MKFTLLHMIVAQLVPSLIELVMRQVTEGTFNVFGETNPSLCVGCVLKLGQPAAHIRNGGSIKMQFGREGITAEPDCPGSNSEEACTSVGRLVTDWADFGTATSFDHPPHLSMLALSTMLPWEGHS